jgi:hypothetical protein
VDRLDEDGRPVGEIGSRLYDPDRTELVACPYADERKGHPMNRSALRQLGACWPDVVRAARWIVGQAPTVGGVWAAAITATALPHAWRDEEPVPRVLSALYKTSLGMSQATAALLLADDGVADVPFASLGDDEDFFRFLDAGRWLVGRDQACAGPEPMIRELVRALVDERPLEDPPRALRDVNVDGVRQTAVRVAGVQAVTLLGVAQCVGRGVRDGLDGSLAEGWLEGRAPAWLRSALSGPGRRPEHVRRLFPAGGTPTEVEELLASPPGTPGEWATAAAAASGRRQRECEARLLR